MTFGPCPPKKSSGFSYDTPYVYVANTNYLSTLHRRRMQDLIKPSLDCLNTSRITDELNGL